MAAAVIQLSPMLQWGLGFSAEESEMTARGWTGHESASMGPRLFSRGKSIDIDIPLAYQVASMGPRLFSRGKGNSGHPGGHKRTGFNGASAFQPRKGVLTATCLSRASKELQWGLGFSAEERGMYHGHMAGIPELQWGLGFSAEESGADGMGCIPSSYCFNGASAFQPRKADGKGGKVGRRRSFNGASAFQPRKVGRTGWAVYQARIASMGPRLFSRGKNHTKKRQVREVVGFNGASAFQPRKDEQAAATNEALAGFNGASAFQPRKGLLVSARRKASRLLQWGLGFSAEESRSTLLHPFRVWLASMGPRLFSRGKIEAAKLNEIQAAAGFNGASAFQPRKGS